jgi:hypothetical protein
MKDQHQVAHSHPPSHHQRGCFPTIIVGRYDHDLCRANGKGVVQNVSQAVHYWKLAADQGDSFGEHDDGHCLEDGKV